MKEYIIPSLIVSVPSLLLCIFDLRFGIGIGMVLWLIIHFLIGGLTLAPLVNRRDSGINEFLRKV